MATPPPVPPVPDADRYVRYDLTVLTTQVPVPFPVYGDVEDIDVMLDGFALNTGAWGFSSLSGNGNVLPITDGVVTFSPAIVGTVEIVGDWRPRQISMATASGIGRREFNQVIGTIISGMRETARRLRSLFVPALTFNGAGPIANRPAGASVPANYVWLQTDDAQGRVVFWLNDISTGTYVWVQLVATGPQGPAGANGTNGLNGTSVSLKNRIINGTFAINQRGYVSGSAIAAGVYAHDRWKAGAGGANYTFATSGIDTTVTIVSGTLVHVIEGANIEGGNYRLSWTGTAQARVNGGSYAASPISLASITAGANVTVEFGTGTVTDVQLEPGTSVTSFERRPISYEQAACERYFRWLPIDRSGFTYGGYNETVPLTFQTMRTTPTIGSPVADPSTAQSSSNVSSYFITAVSASSALCSVIAAGTGAYSIIGWRAPASAEL